MKNDEREDVATESNTVALTAVLDRSAGTLKLFNPDGSEPTTYTAILDADGRIIGFRIQGTLGFRLQSTPSRNRRTAPRRKKDKDHDEDEQKQSVKTILKRSWEYRSPKSSLEQEYENGFVALVGLIFLPFILLWNYLTAGKFFPDDW
jgi:hypothetical protein